MINLGEIASESDEIENNTVYDYLIKSKPLTFYGERIFVDSTIFQFIRSFEYKKK